MIIWNTLYTTCPLSEALMKSMNHTSRGKCVSSIVFRKLSYTKFSRMSIEPRLPSVPTPTSFLTPYFRSKFLIHAKFVYREQARWSITFEVKTQRREAMGNTPHSRMAACLADRQMGRKLSFELSLLHELKLYVRPGSVPALDGRLGRSTIWLATLLSC